MNRKLYQMALITSPIIAIYGVLPFFVFKIIEPKEVLILTLGLAINTFLAWVILINLKIKFPSLNNIWLFLASYGVNILIRLILLTFLAPFDFAKPPIDDKYFVYPVATSFALNAVIIVIMNSIFYSYKNADTQRQLQEIKLQHSEAQKLVLLQQMQPHFLFNALSNLKSLIKENAGSAQDYVVKLSEFLRYSVEAHQTEVVSLKKELDFTEDYIDLQKVRFDNAFTYDVDIPNEVMQYQLPVLALQTLVENIFKHNYFTEKKPLHFTITYKPNEITVWNRKSSVKLTERSSTGLNNLNKRYELIFHKSISIKDADEEFIVIIPLLPT